MFTLLGIMKEKVVKRVAASGNFNSVILAKTVDHGVAIRTRNDGSLQIGIATSIKDNGQIKLPYTEQRTHKSGLNIFDIPKNGPVTAVFNAFKNEFNTNNIGLPQKVLLQTLTHDFSTGPTVNAR